MIQIVTVYLNATFDVELHMLIICRFKQVFLLLSVCMGYGVATVYGYLELLMFHHIFALVYLPHYYIGDFLNSGEYNKLLMDFVFL